MLVNFKLMKKMPDIPKKFVFWSVILWIVILILSFPLRGRLEPFVSLILYAWIFLTIYIFKRYPPEQALIFVFIAATLFLPEFVLPIRSDLNINKTTATALGGLLATLIFYPKRLFSLRPGFCDLPMVIWMIAAIPSQSLNGLSPVTPVIQHFLTWGVPYLLSRIFLTSLADLYKLAIGIFLGGLIYAPLCIFETIKTPNLHNWVYGFPARAGSYLQTMRLGGYRPTVFMNHGLAVGMWMMAATLVGLWLWQMKAIPSKLWNYRIELIVFGLLFVFTQTRSTGAYLYGIIGILILLSVKWFRTALALLLVAMISISYVSLGAVGNLYEIPQVQAFINEDAEGDSGTDDREGSFRFRMQNEEILSEHARKQFIFGWGEGAGRNRVYNARGDNIVTTDSLWILEFGYRGIVGLWSFFLVLLLPPLSFAFFRYPAHTWRVPKVAAAASLAAILVLYAWDSSLNAFPNPVYMLASGGLASVVMKPREKLTDTAARLPVQPQRRLLPTHTYRRDRLL